jgi:murein DD-endopeptidase MepM/ murein hydrolase activator NlpD
MRYRDDEFNPSEGVDLNVQPDGSQDRLLGEPDADGAGRFQGLRFWQKPPSSAEEFAAPYAETAGFRLRCLAGGTTNLARQAFAPDRRAFLKDIALLGLCGFTIYDRRKPAAQGVIQAAPSLESARAAALPNDVLGDIALSAPSLLIPLAGFRMRTLPSSRLPNALREYRQGVHEGFDLYAPFGTTIYAMADGVVTKADEHFELDAELHRLYLAESGQLQTTPPDILDHLRGRVVEIDHGVGGGIRWRSVYGHLSRVLVNPGQRVTQGELIAKVGNSGTTAGVKGSREDAHLHLEIRYQRAGQREHYIGEGLTERQIRRLLEEMFHA